MTAENGIAALSKRELEIARAYSNGASYREIAESLFVAPATVRSHLQTIFRKLCVKSKVELHMVLVGEKPDGNLRSDPENLISELALSLEESISREKALGEILRIISRSNGDIVEVISEVLRHTLELCDAQFGILFDYTPHQGFTATFSKGIPQAFDSWLKQQGSFHVSPQTGLGRVVASHDVVNIPDVRGESAYHDKDPLRLATADLGGARSFTAIPMLSGHRLIGAFTIYRQRVRPFNAKNLDIAKMFADQSVIAIENARLLSEVKKQKSR